MTIKLPPPLPECTVCGTPTRRAVHNATGGLCSTCKRTYTQGGLPTLAEVRESRVQLELDMPTPAEASNVVPFRRKGRRR